MFSSITRNYRGEFNICSYCLREGLSYVFNTKSNYFTIFIDCLFVLATISVLLSIYVLTLKSLNKGNCHNLSQILTFCLLIFLYIILRSFFDATFSCVAFITSTLILLLLLCTNIHKLRPGFFFTSNPLYNCSYVFFLCYYDASGICSSIITEYQTIPSYPNFFFLQVCFK